MSLYGHDETDSIWCILIFAIWIFVGGLLYMAGASSGRNVMKLDAVEAGVGRWEVVDKTGKTEFKWNVPEGKAQEKDE